MPYITGRSQSLSYDQEKYKKTARVRPTINLVREKNPKDVKRRRDFSFNDNNGWPLKYENYRPEASPRLNCLPLWRIYLPYTGEYR